MNKGDYIRERLIWMKKIIVILLAIFMFFSLFGEKEVVNGIETVSIIGVGDLMLGTNYPSSKYLPGKNILKGVEDILKDADITFGNLEGTILNSGGTPKTCKDCFTFRMPEYTVDYLKEAGFDVLSLANDHSRDFGATGAKNTMKLLDKTEIHYAGLTECPYTIFEKDGIKYGFCAFAPDYSGVMHFTDAVNIIKYLDARCDIVIVSFHMGAEGNGYEHITRKTEYFLGENRGDPYHLAREAIDAGADVVFGQGPHVTRAIDVYKNRFIAYSLGDFATYGRFDLTDACGVAPIVKIYVSKKGEFLSGRIYSIKLVERGIPVIDSNQTALKKIIDLTKSDIPESPLTMEKNGVFKLASKPVTVINLQIGKSTFTVDGISHTLDIPPLIKNGRTMLPIRAVIEALKGKVIFDEGERKVTITLGSKTIELSAYESTAKVNGIDTPIDSTNLQVTPEIINGRILLPVRFVTESLGCLVDWNPHTKTVTITYVGG